MVYKILYDLGGDPFIVTSLEFSGVYEVFEVPVYGFEVFLGVHVYGLGVSGI